MMFESKFSLLRRIRMTQSRFCRTSLVAFCAVAFVIAGCGKKQVASRPQETLPPPPAAKPTVSISADRTSISKGDSVKLSWTSTDAQNISIAPEVGAVTAQGTTTVTPGDSTTYTITASGTGGNAEASVRISVEAPVAVVQPTNTSLDELFMQEVRDVFFDYDSAEIRADARDALRKTSDFLKGHPQMRVTIEGHCDERGSTEYNLALGDRRANAVKQYLISLGNSGSNLNTVSFGKEKPFCMEANEACYAKNRRGHFVQAK
jgi:peptidoglycan-associated lipoprotein